MKIEFPELSTDLSRISVPCSVQAKYDGELVVWKDGCLTNRFGRQRWNMPCTRGLPKDLELEGELYWGTGKRNFYEAMTHLRNNDPLLKLAVFGFYHADLTYVEQLQLLTLLAKQNELMHIVEHKNAYSHAEVEYYHKLYLADGYEGTVIKPYMAKSERSWIKWKPDETMDLLVVGISKNKSAIAVGLHDGVALGHCSTLGKEKEVEAVLGGIEIIGETKEDYLINPEIVVEVKHLGVIPQTGHLRNPRLLRFREDKSL
jgi:hypothetical protein